MSAAAEGDLAGLEAVGGGRVETTRTGWYRLSLGKETYASCAETTLEKFFSFSEDGSDFRGLGELVPSARLEREPEMGETSSLRGEDSPFISTSPSFFSSCISA